MDSFEHKEAQLTPEDRTRMQQLSAEIQERLKEMLAIFAKTVSITIDDSFTVRYEPQPHKTHTEPGGQDIHLVCSPDGICGCYVDPPGICVYTGSPTGC
jgi:hypothetical protein